VSDFIDVYNGIDWETQDVSDFQQALSDAGVETSLTTAQLEALANALTEMENTTAGVVNSYATSL